MSQELAAKPRSCSTGDRPTKELGKKPPAREYGEHGLRGERGLLDRGKQDREVTRSQARVQTQVHADFKRPSKKPPKNTRPISYFPKS